MFLAVIMISLAIGAAALIWHFIGWIAGLAFVVTLFAGYRLLTHENGRARPLDRTRLNAFQRPLSDD